MARNTCHQRKGRCDTADVPGAQFLAQALLDNRVELIDGTEWSAHRLDQALLCMSDGVQPVCRVGILTHATSLAFRSPSTSGSLRAATIARG
jgi:hypothetical protein